MRTESQQTNSPKFPYKNKHKKAGALHHTFNDSTQRPLKAETKQDSKH